MAAEALFRIIGAEPSDPSAREQGSPRNVEAKAWRELWLQRSEQFEPGCRYRFGATYQWQASHAELLRDGVRQRDRGILALELALAGGDTNRGAVLPIHTWHAAQLRQLDELLDVMTH